MKTCKICVYKRLKKFAMGTTKMVNSYERLLQRNDLIEDVQNHFLELSKEMCQLTKIVLDNDKDFEQFLASNPNLKKTLALAQQNYRLIGDKILIISDLQKTIYGTLTEIAKILFEEAIMVSKDNKSNSNKVSEIIENFEKNNGEFQINQKDLAEFINKEALDNEFQELLEGYNLIPN